MLKKSVFIIFGIIIFFILLFVSYKFLFLEKKCVHNRLYCSILCSEYISCPLDPGFCADGFDVGWCAKHIDRKCFDIPNRCSECVDNCRDY
jgi:hypothetical protein